MRPLLNIDAGESSRETDELYALADALNIACGGHVGDEVSMVRVLLACARHRVRAGAHPSYPDRLGFGRVSMKIDPIALERAVAEQCAALSAISERSGIAIEHAKLHGALYHDANHDPEIAASCLRGIGRALGPVAIVGMAGGALETVAMALGHDFEREGFADRGLEEDGTLIPRGQPGAVIEDPARAAARVMELAASGSIDTICVHGDTRGAVQVARAVREALDRIGAK